MDNFDIDFFQLDNGNYPVKEYLNATDVKMRAKILWTIGLLEKTVTHSVCRILNIYRTEYLN